MGFGCGIEERGVHFLNNKRISRKAGSPVMRDSGFFPKERFERKELLTWDQANNMNMLEACVMQLAASCK
jgi:hypothetical protein